MARKYKLGFIGAGNMAWAIADGVLRAGLYTGPEIIASDIAEEAKRTDGICLVLSDRKAHCKTLQAYLKYNYKVDSELLVGSLTNKQRQEVLDRLHSGKVKVLIATGQLVGEGFDAKNLSVLFLTMPIKFSGRLLQYLGRVLRSAPGKKKAFVYDYVDVNVGVLKAAARSRQGAGQG